MIGMAAGIGRGEEVGRSGWLAVGGRLVGRLDPGCWPVYGPYGLMGEHLGEGRDGFLLELRGLLLGPLQPAFGPLRFLGQLAAIELLGDDPAVENSVAFVPGF